MEAGDDQNGKFYYWALVRFFFSSKYRQLADILQMNFNVRPGEVKPLLLLNLWNSVPYDVVMPAIFRWIRQGGRAWDNLAKTLLSGAAYFQTDS